MKIGFFEVGDWEKEYFSKELKESKKQKNELRFFEKPLNEKNFEKVKDCEAISVFIYSKINKEVLNKLPKLKLIATRSTGFDHIDVEECKKKKIIVKNVPFYGENTVAEHAFALILSLSRNIHKSHVRTLKDDFSIKDLMGFDLKNKTIGIVGGGNIGMHVARIAKGFQMNVLVYDIILRKDLAKSIGFKYVELDYLLKNSNIISLHLPQNKFTYHIINKDKFSLMKKGVILINTSRGGVIDTGDLLDALKKGIFRGVGLDVIEGEDLIKEEENLDNEKQKQIDRNKKIFKMDNVIFTPHNAFNSREALIRILDTTIENLENKNKKLNSVAELKF